MSGSANPEPAASPPVDDAVAAALGALLLDRDVSEVQCLEGGFLQVIRRGRRERLDALLEGPLFELLREEGGERGLVTCRLRGGHRLVVAPCGDGRQALRILKAPSLDVELDALVAEQLLPPGLPEELVAAASLGGVLVLGPSRAGRQRVATAVARAAQRTLAFASLTEVTAALFPMPAGDDVAARARAADALGFDALFALDLDGHDCARLLAAAVGLPVVASARATTMEALAQALGGAPAGALAPLCCVVAATPDGRPRLFEVHGSIEGASLEPTAPEASLRPQPSRGLALGPGAGDDDDDDLGAEDAPPLAELPTAWASDAPDDDPGWELAGLPAEAAQPAGAVSGPTAPVGPSTGASFDAALARQAARPSFQPRPPRPHPQAATLRGPGNPFGGLTFEPPAAPPGTASADGDGGPDEEPG